MNGPIAIYTKIRRYQLGETVLNVCYLATESLTSLQIKYSYPSALRCLSKNSKFKRYGSLDRDVTEITVKTQTELKVANCGLGK